MPDGYKESMAKLNEQQLEAVKQIEGPVLVIAGPGTGKTQLLTTRIAHILKTTDTLPENILCLTFTESGATAMRDRLFSLIGKSAYDVTISTYHGFGNSLISRYPDYFLGYSDQQEVDELGTDTIIREIIAALPYSNPLKYSEGYVSDIKSLISDAKRAALKPADLRLVAKRNLSYAKQVDPIIRGTLEQMVRITKKSIPLFAQLLKDLGKLPSSAKYKNADILRLEILLNESLKQAVYEAEAADNPKGLTKWKNDWLEKDSDNNYVLAGNKANLKLVAAADVYELYEQELKSRQLYDYDDMILRATEVLKANDEFRYSLQERYQYLLLDEFQDTNGVQFKLVELLCDNPVNEGRPNVLAVGDDDQAIFAFQGAHYSHMLRFLNMYKDVKLISLTRNYRSSTAILDLASAISEQIETSLNHLVPEFNKRLVSGLKTVPGTLVERRVASSEVAQYGWVARQIKQLLDKDIKPTDIAIIASKHRYLEPLSAYLTQEGIAQRYERSENVLDNPAINELRRMADLVLALANNEYELADSLWPEVLSYDFWVVPTDLIWNLAWQAHDQKALWTNLLLGNEKLAGIALFFIRLSMLAKSETLEIMMDYLIGIEELEINGTLGNIIYRSSYYSYYFEQPVDAIKSNEVAIDKQRYGKFWQLLSDLSLVRSKLKNYSRSEDLVLKLPDFIRFIDDHRAAGIKITNVNIYAESPDAVQLMTAHKSKGQEFKVLFVLDNIDEAWGTRARSRNFRISLPPNLQFMRYGGITNDERLRLYYVALTRGRQQLYLMGYNSTLDGKSVIPLTYLNEQVSEDGVLVSPWLPEGSQAVLAADGGQSELSRSADLTAYWRARHSLALDKRVMMALIRGRLNGFQLSATDINEFTDIVHAGPYDFFLYKLLRFPKASTPELRYGVAMHDTLYWIHVYNKNNGKLPTLRSVINKFSGIIKKQRLADDLSDQLIKRGSGALKVYLEQRASTIAADNQCEYNFRNEGVFIGPAHMSGKIDKLIIDHRHKTITIVDYKTGTAHNRWDRSVKMHRYAQQLYVYKLLVEKSHGFAGYKVNDAYVEFVEPNEEGKIIELHIQFNDQAQKLVESLANSIWKNIQSVKFPDIESYSKDIKGIEAFEQSLVNGED